MHEEFSSDIDEAIQADHGELKEEELLVIRTKRRNKQRINGNS